MDYQGNQVGNEIHLMMMFPWKSKWVSKIIEVSEKSNVEKFFIDKGIVLPFGLTYWEHKHIVRQKSVNELEIEDAIRLDAKNILLTIFFKLIFIVQFKARRKKYKIFFKNNKAST